MSVRLGNARVFVYCALLYSTNHTAALLEFLIASLKCRQFFVYHHNKLQATWHNLLLKAAR
jgi:hypothetical protein